MVTQIDIQNFANEIGRRYHADRVILFGSRATGSERTDSDVDVLVIMDYEGRTPHKAADILAEINPRFSCDLLVRRSTEIDQRLDANDRFIREIIDNGKTLYDGRMQGVA